MPRLSTSLEESESLKFEFDLLITETFDAGLFGEHVLETLDHAHKNLLSKDSEIIPRGARVYVALLKCGILERQHSFSGNSCGPLSFSALRLVPSVARQFLDAANDPYDSIDLRSLPPGQFTIISDPVEIGEEFIGVDYSLENLGFNFRDPVQVEKCLVERNIYR